MKSKELDESINTSKIRHKYNHSEIVPCWQRCRASGVFFFTGFPWYNTLQSSHYLRDFFFFTKALNYALLCFALLSWHMITHSPPTFTNKNNCRTNHLLHLFSRFGYTETILQADKIMYMVEL